MVSELRVTQLEEEEEKKEEKKEEEKKRRRRRGLCASRARWTLSCQHVAISWLAFVEYIPFKKIFQQKMGSTGI